MCYAIPGKVKAIEGTTVVVDYFGDTKKAKNELHDLHVGDFICAQGGYVIRKVSAQEAHDIITAWRELFFELQDIDVRLSRLDSRPDIGQKLKVVLDKALEGISLQREELVYLFGLAKTDELDFLFKAANFLRQKYHKNSCCIHGIIEISNYCRCQCSYCGIFAGNKRLGRYRMSPEEIVTVACQAVRTYGFQALVLQGGEDYYYSPEILAKVVRKIKEEVAVLICISFGEIGIKGLHRLYDAGARGLLLRFETSNHQLYARLHPGRNLDTRLEHIKKAAEKGYLIMTGGLIGLPGQTADDIVNDIYLAKALGAEMYSFGPFLPHADTPLSDCAPASVEQVLKTLALIRLIDPEQAKVLVSSAFETLHLQARRQGLMAGANSLMLNVTPLGYRRKYEIYPNRACVDDSVTQQIADTIALLQSLGRAPTDLGIHQKTP